MAAPAKAAADASKEAKRRFDLPADTAEKALKAFSAQAGVEVLFSSDAAAGVRTRAVKGEFTPLEAANLMLDGTALYVRDEKNGVVRIAKAIDPNVNRAIAQNSGRPGRGKGEDQTNKKSEELLTLDTFEVTGSRLRSTIDIAAAQPVVSFTRRDLDRLGVQTFNDFQRYVPQLPATIPTSIPEGQNTIQDFNTFGNGLRGLGNTGTLILVNGRRVTKLGQSNVLDSYSLSSIPMSAVERIDILTDGASALYGADAIGGVVNIILKRKYVGAELTASYGNTFKSDTAERQLQLAYGYRQDAWSINIGATWSEANSLAARDRWFLASSDFRPFGGTDRRSTVPGGPGVVRSVNGANLPGLTSSVAAIPAGSSGIGLTIADFANAGPIPENVDFRQLVTYGGRHSHSLRFGVEYEFRPWLRPFVEGNYARTLSETPASTGNTNGSGLTLNTVTLPVGYAGNPFGVPIRLQRVYWEIFPYLDRKFETKDRSLLFGLRGQLPHNWRYEMGVQRSSTDYSAEGRLLIGSAFSSALVQAAVNSTDAALRPILLNDGIHSSPNSPAMLQSFITPSEDYRELPETWTYDLNLDGNLTELPAGPLKLAIGAEFIEDYSHFALTRYPTDAVGRVGIPYQRSLWAVFAETQVPIVAPAQAIPFVHKLSVNLSARRDEYSDFGSAVSPRASIFYFPWRQLALRGSYGEGFKVPLLTQVTAPITTTSGFNLASFTDPFRGNQVLGGIVPSIRGGNPGLQPERSTNLNVGMILEVPKVKGLSFSLDYYDIKYIDRIAFFNQFIQEGVVLFPERFSRAAPSAADLAAGFHGPVTGVDIRAINISYLRRSGLDFELRYERATPYGEINLRANVTVPKVSKTRAHPHSVELDDLVTQPRRGAAMLFWSHGPYSLGTTTTYTSSRSASSGLVGSVILWDLSAAVSFDDFEGGRDLRAWRRKVLHGLTISANCFNIFDREPRISTTGVIMDEVASKGRRYQVTFSKKF